jgi:DNA polymerase III gamma/tau subunit
MWALDYRPQTFDDVVGQDKAISILERSVGKSNVFILFGGSGVGKTTLARIFSDSINGEAIEINGSSHNGVDDIRGLITSASYQPAFKDYKVFIIDECHMLSTAAWNAMLKILEETPKTTLWILCTTEYNKIPTTIKTRATLVPFARIPKKLIMERLYQIAKWENKTLDPKTADTIATMCNGSLREAVSLMETWFNTGELFLTFGLQAEMALLRAVFCRDALMVNAYCADMTNEDVFQLIHLIYGYLQLLTLRTALPATVTTETIMDDYTDISSAYIDDLRNLQGEVSRCAEPGKDMVAENFRLMYGLFTELMAHYNDFRPNRVPIAIVLLNYMVKVNG